MTRAGTLLRLAVPTTSAHAASCGTDMPVTVVVDYGALGGGMADGCGSGATADKAFTSAGATLSQAPNQPGFVCKVNQKPADGHCLGTASYWGFFVSDDGHSWKYASLGVYQQKVQAGDWVALAWQSASQQRAPGQPVVADPAPTRTPTKTPTTAGSAVPGNGKSTKTPKPKRTTAPTEAATRTTGVPEATTTGSAGARASGSASPTPSTSPSSSATSSLVPTPTGAVTPTSDLTPGASTDAEPTSAESGGLPGWVPPVVIAVLVVAAGGVAWSRRAQRPR